MNFPSDLPRLPKWIFLAGDAALLATAWAIGHHSAHPDAGATLWAIVILVGLAVAVGAYPFIAEDARKYDQALDDRQKALQVLAGTVASAAEQVSVAAAGLQAIADAAQENFRRSEALTGQLAGHIAEFDRRLGHADPAARAEGGEGDARIDAAVKKITRAATALEVTVTKTVEAVRTMPPFSFQAPAAAPAPVEVPPVLAEHMVEIKPVLPATDDSVAPIPPPVPAAPAEEAPSPPPAVAAAPQEQPAEPKPARKRAPRKPRAEAATAAPDAPAPGPQAEPAPPAEAAGSPAAAGAVTSAETASAPAPTPEAVAEAAADTIPPLSFGEEDAAVDEDFSPPPPDPELVQASPPAAPPPAEAPREAAEAARPAGGATRLVVTAYIGIGNRLFIRGDGPGLAWDRGVPLTFVSIGKWRWETNDASRTIRFRLFKNDTVECTALGEQTVEPGAQQELSASF